MAVGCLTRLQILKGHNGLVENNFDGSISVYLPNSKTGVQTPILLTKPCCEALKSSDYQTYFDVETQQCKYVSSTTSSAVNIVLNPKGSDGEWFTVTPDETCTLSIDFDYLFKFTCDDLKPLVPTTNGIINMIENLSASMILDIKSDSTTSLNMFAAPVFPSIGVGNAYTYFSGATNNTGFYICGGLVNDNDSTCNPLNLYSLTETNGILDCSDVQHQIINGLYNESGLPTSGLTAFKTAINENSFSSNWLHFHVDITDPTILSGISNQKIVLTLRVSGVTTDISVLFDNIKLNKTCTKVDNTSIFVTQSPSFELDRLKDNKKSWATKNVQDHRQFHVGRVDDSNQIRETDYFVNYDDRQVINSKEIDLDIDIASAVETDVWNYISNNPCILTGLTVGTTTCIGKVNIETITAQTIITSAMTATTITGITCGDGSFTLTAITVSGETIYVPVPTTGNTYCCSDSCGDKPIDINNLLTQPLSSVTTIEDFEYFLTSELIDVKNRQSITSYPTLRLLYDRYMNSIKYCGNKSSKFDYFTMDKFSKLIGNYWIDLVEQVIPATTIWGSTKIYTNTIFDSQKYKYKAYTSLFGENNDNIKVLSPVKGSDCTVDIITTVIKGQSIDTLEFLNEGNTYEYNNIYLNQMNSSPEYIGNVNILTPFSNPAQIFILPNNSINHVIMECSLGGDITYTYPTLLNNDGTATINIFGANGPINIIWSNGQTTKTITGISAGTYSVTVSEVNNIGCSFTKSITVLSKEYTACWYDMQESPSFLYPYLYCQTNTGITLTIKTLTINSINYITTPITHVLTTSTTHFVSANNLILSGCTSGVPTGTTYTDFIIFLNNTFAILGLNDYKAQLSYVTNNQIGSNDGAGFYIIRPKTDTFGIYVMSSFNPNNYLYTNNSLLGWNDGGYTYNLNYGAMTCDGITLINNIVTE